MQTGYTAASPGASDLNLPTRLFTEWVVETIGTGRIMAAPVDDPLKPEPRSDQELIAAINDGDTGAFHASQLGAAPLPATPENVRRGLAYLRSLNSEGGTMMIEGIKAALDFKHDPRRLRFVCFLTDGYIGNEAEILGEIHRRIRASRIFSFGVGPAVNLYLLDHMARLGRGAVAYLGLNENAASLMNDFFDRISRPTLTDIQINWGELQVRLDRVREFLEKRARPPGARLDTLTGAPASGPAGPAVPFDDAGSETGAPGLGADVGGSVNMRLPACSSALDSRAPSFDLPVRK
jgi:hypothetical protein